MSGLTEREKQIAWDAFYVLWSLPESTKRECVWAAVEAVLAQREQEPKPHRWTGVRAGGSPAEAGSYEYVRYCQDCGIEDTCEDPLPPCPSQPSAKVSGEQEVARAWNIVWELAHRDKVIWSGIDGAMSRLIEEAQSLLSKHIERKKIDKQFEGIGDFYKAERGYTPDPIAVPSAGEPAYTGEITAQKIEAVIGGLLIPSLAFAKALAQRVIELEEALRKYKGVRNGHGIVSADLALGLPCQHDFRCHDPGDQGDGCLHDDKGRLKHKCIHCNITARAALGRVGK